MDQHKRRSPSRTNELYFLTENLYTRLCHLQGARKKKTPSWPIWTHNSPTTDHSRTATLDFMNGWVIQVQHIKRCNLHNIRVLSNPSQTFILNLSQAGLAHNQREFSDHDYMYRVFKSGKWYKFRGLFTMEWVCTLIMKWILVTSINRKII